MACATAPLPSDDQSFALQLQLEEIETQRELQSGKWTEDNPPDFALAFDDFESELKKAIGLLEDLRLAHSIAKAVDADAAEIEESTIEEAQSVQDRDLALSLNEDGDVPARSVVDLSETSSSHIGTASQFEMEWVDWDHVLRGTESSTFSDDTASTVAGPSNQYAVRQQAAFEHLPQQRVQCCVCSDMVYPNLAVRQECKDVYCKPCLKDFFLRVAKDESLYPPRCHGHPFDISTVVRELSSEELHTYRLAEQEFLSNDRVYCSNPHCAKFIPMPQRTAHRASCEVCCAETCMHCKSQAHEGVCPEDEGMQNFIAFADTEEWRSCFGCGQMVSRHEGCDHMTCLCRAEFCYRCGVKWKECSCSDWAPELLNRRAQMVVDREAQLPMAPAVRQQRVRAMEQQLRTNHECNHRGRFTRLEGSRRGKVCEMCGDRHWKYILSCRQCHMLACEDCRRHRV